MTVYFSNKVPIDLNAIAIMGVSVKDTDTPIGFFGTGLKFAIATFLRTGHTVTLFREGQEIRFTARPEVIRGEEFHRVWMADEPLGFTTRLGRTWEPWQAYRELYSNCLDEKGEIGTELPPPDTWGTGFIVVGDAVDTCHRTRGEIFLQSTAISATAECEIHAGAGEYVYYRGVRAGRLNNPGRFTYNILAAMDLTEDRTLKYPYMVEFYAERVIAAAREESLLEQALMAPKGTFEGGLDYDGVSDRPSDAFMAVARDLRNNAHSNINAVKLWRRHEQARIAYETVAIDGFEAEQLDAALRLVRRLGAAVTREDVLVMSGLGESVYGLVRDRQILIAHAAFDLGTRFLASTIYEEFLHKSERLRDETRALQNVLFEKLFAMVERVMAMEARQA